MTDIPGRVRSVVRSAMAMTPDEVRDDTCLIRDLRADSLDIVEIVMGLEDEFGIAITDDEGEKIRTIADAIALVERQLAEPVA